MRQAFADSLLRGLGRAGRRSWNRPACTGHAYAGLSRARAICHVADALPKAEVGDSLLSNPCCHRRASRVSLCRPGMLHHMVPCCKAGERRPSKVPYAQQQGFDRRCRQSVAIQVRLPWLRGDPAVMNLATLQVPQLQYQTLTVLVAHTASL